MIFGLSNRFNSQVRLIGCTLIGLSLSAILMTSCTGLGGPGGHGPDGVPGTSGVVAPAPSPGGSANAVDESQVLEAQASQARKVEVTCTLPVKKLLRDDTEGLPHQRFLLSLSNGSTILVAHDTAMAPRVPISPGDLVTIHGEYIWNSKGGVIHWTHRSDTPRHEGGYIDFQSQRYQ